jgi:hypothetical protein
MFLDGAFICVSSNNLIALQIFNLIREKPTKIASAFEFLTKAEIMKRVWNGQGEWDRPIGRGRATSGQMASRAGAAKVQFTEPGSGDGVRFRRDLLPIGAM